VKIRDYRAEDFDTLCEIDQRCFPPGIAYSPDDIAMSMLEPGTFIVIGEHEDAVAGFLLARAERGGRGHIITIDVIAEHRRSGLGALLLEAAHARLAGRRVILEVAVDNEAAIAFYKKHGYVTLRRLKKYYLDRDDAWQMVKQT
jgi:ribosomal-protein-alanine N-acetyltransferase